MTDAEKLASLQKSLQLIQQHRDEAIFNLRHGIKQLDAQIKHVVKSSGIIEDLTNSRIAILRRRLNLSPVSP